MRNPLVDEDAAFRLVLGTIAYFVPIVVAAWIATWLGVIVFVIASAVVVIVLWKGRGARATSVPGPAAVPAQAAVEDTFRLLVVANDGLGGQRLLKAVRRLSDTVAEDVLVVCPLSPDAPADEVDRAGLRLRSALEELEAAGVNARGELVHADPLAAVEEALQIFRPDEVVVVVAAADRAGGLDEGLVDAARTRYPGPVTVVRELT